MITTLPTSVMVRSHHGPRRQICATNQPATVLKGMILRLRRVFEIPFGYEDEAGFHYGLEPSPMVLSFEI